MATIFHLALASEWAAAQESGAYTTSTLGRSLAEEGFIHASRADQWTAVRDRYYSGVTEPLVLLQIDTDLLDVPVVDEPAGPGDDETFPHIYGRLPASAVVRATPLDANARAVSTATAAPERAAPEAAAAPTGRPRPAESFSRAYFREMFFNVALLCLVIGAGLLGAGIGRTVSSDGGVGVGGLTGMLVGLVAAAALFRHRHAR